MQIIKSDPFFYENTGASKYTGAIVHSTTLQSIHFPKHAYSQSGHSGKFSSNNKNSCSYKKFG